MNNHDFPFTHAVALGSATAPLWLQDISGGAAAVLPILGVGWLLLQAFVYIRNNFWRPLDADRKPKL